MVEGRVSILGMNILECPRPGYRVVYNYAPDLIQTMGGRAYSRAGRAVNSFFGAEGRAPISIGFVASGPIRDKRCPASQKHDALFQRINPDDRVSNRV